MIFDSDRPRTPNHATESIGRFLMDGYCLHEFSWPRRAADSRYYQVCILCNCRYEYDWQSMRRIEPESASSERLTPNSSAHPKLLLDLEPAHRVFFETWLICSCSAPHLASPPRPDPRLSGEMSLSTRACPGGGSQNR